MLRFFCASMGIAMLVSCGGGEQPPLVHRDWLRDQVIPAPEQPFAAEQQDFPLDLVTLLDYAGTKPLAIALAQAQAEAADAAETEAYSRWLPTLSPRLGFFRHQGEIQSTQGQFLDVDKQNSFAGSGVDVSVNFAEAWFASEAAGQRARAGRIGVETAQHVNVGRAVFLYYQLLQEQAALQITTQAVEYARELLRVTQARAQQGRELQAEVLRSQAFLAQVEGREAEVRAMVEEASARLAALLFLPDNFRLASAQQRVVPIRFPEAELPVDTLVQRALQARPDLRQARALRAAAEADHDEAAWGWMVPDLHAGALFGGFGDTPGDLRGQEQYFLGVQWNLGLGALARTRIADAHRREAALQVTSLEQDIRAEIQIAKAMVNSARIRVAAGQREVEAAGAALGLVTASHRAGRSLLLEVLDAQRAATEARIHLVRAISAQNWAQLELRRMVGG